MVFEHQHTKHPDDDYGLPQVALVPLPRSSEPVDRFDSKPGVPPLRPYEPKEVKKEPKITAKTGSTEKPVKPKEEHPPAVILPTNERVKRNYTGVILGWILAALVFGFVVFAAIFYYQNDYLPFIAPQTQSIEQAPTIEPEALASPFAPEELDDDAGWDLGEVEWEDRNESEQEIIVEKEDVAPPQDAGAIQDRQVLELTTSDKAFHMIIGSHPNLPSAQKDAPKYLNQGFEITILHPRAGREENFRISAGQFTTLQEAQEQLGRFRQSYGESVWILRY
jgi:hypothetical protein